MDEAWGEDPPISMTPLVGEKVVVWGEGMVVADQVEEMWDEAMMMYADLAIGMEVEEVEASS